MHSRPIHLYSVQSVQSRHFNTFLQFLQSENNYRWIEQCIEKKTTTKTAHSSLISQSKLKRTPPNPTAEKRKSRAHWLGISVDFHTSLPWIRSPAVPFPALHLQNHPSHRHSCAHFFLPPLPHNDCNNCKVKGIPTLLHQAHRSFSCNFKLDYLLNSE